MKSYLKGVKYSELRESKQKIIEAQMIIDGKFDDTIFEDQGLPKELQSQLKEKRQTQCKSMILLDLFDVRPELNIDHLLIGMFKMFGKVVSRDWINTQICILKRKGYIKKSERKAGYFEITR